jgi:hypothetical protein
MTAVILTNLVAAAICIVPAVATEEARSRHTDFAIRAIRIVLTCRHLFDTIAGAADLVFPRAVAIGTTFRSLSTGAIDTDLAGGTLCVCSTGAAVHASVVYALLLVRTLVACSAFRARAFDAKSVTAIPI